MASLRSMTVTVAVLTAGVLAVSFPVVSLHAGSVVPGIAAEEADLSMRGTVNGPCSWGGGADYCSGNAACLATGGACRFVGAACTAGNYSGAYNYWCSDYSWWPTCTPYTVPCYTTTSSCVNIGGGGGCGCSGTLLVPVNLGGSTFLC
jgi:hypothetical protein